MSEPYPPPVGSRILSNSTRWMIFAALLCWGLPHLAWQVQYAWTRSRLQAEWDHARGQLAEVGHRPDGRFRLVTQAVAPSVVRLKMLQGNLDADAEPQDSVAEPEDRPGAKPSRRRKPAPPQDDEHLLGEGSGVVVSQDGYILTNQHVIEQGEDIWAKFHDGRVLRAEVVGLDPQTDLALLKVAARDLLPATWGSSDGLETGDWVLAVGNPFGLESTVTAGIVSAKGRRNLRAGQTYQDYLQTDAAVNPGNSGGPLVDMKGEVVGINTMILGSRYQGISFAIPSGIARVVWERLRRDGRVARGWLGVTLEELVGDAEQSTSDAPQVAIRAVQPGGPADRAGVRPRDVVVSWNGETAKTLAEFRWRIAVTEAGSSAVLTVLRGEERLDLTVDVVERPGM